MTPSASLVGWTTADYALIVSVVSLCFAVASFVWNVWSKFIFPKPKVEVFAGYFVSGNPKDSETDHYIMITVVNHGPMPATIKLLIGRSRSWHTFFTGRFKPSIIKHWGLTRQNVPPIKLPSKIEPGDEQKFMFDGRTEWFANEPSFQVGVVDIYGRRMFVSTKDMKRIKASQDRHK